jgi:hypothetical protein
MGKLWQTLKAFSLAQATPAGHRTYLISALKFRYS